MNIQISGNLCGPTAIFIAGWPDTCDVFRDNIMATLAADYRIVGITLPGFDDDHPFLKLLREQGMCTSLSGARASTSHGSTHNAAAAPQGSSWLPNTFPFSYFHAEDLAKRAAEAENACLVNGLRLRHGRAPLEPFSTTWKGHSFQDLVTMLEIAVDTAMETCNYCPTTLPSTNGPTASPTRSRRSEANNTTKASAAARHSAEEKLSHNLGDVPLHQLPPSYTRPVLIAHDWGCLLAYELLLVRPNLFSRMVALDIGGYMFEKDAAHVERMCGLVLRSEKNRTATSAVGSPTSAPQPLSPAGTSFFRASEPQGLSRSFGGSNAVTTAAGSGHERASAVTQRRTGSRQVSDAAVGSGDARTVRDSLATPVPESSSPTSLHQRNNSISQHGGTTTSSPVTVVHGVAAGAAHPPPSSSAFDVLTPTVANTSQLRTSVSGAATKRSLASQYAIRRKKPTQQSQRAEARKGIAIILYQFSLILCELFIPHRVARWLIGCFVSLIGRPTYCYDPQVVSTPTVELLNHSINVQFFAQHPYALENRGAFDLPVLLQLQDGANSASSRLTEASFPSINLEHPSLMRNGKTPTRLLPGWKIMLIPFTEGKPIPLPSSGHAKKVMTEAGQEVEEERTRRVHERELSSPLAHHRSRRRHYEDSSISGHSERSTTRHSDHRGGSSTSTDMSNDDLTSPLQASAHDVAAWSEKATTAAAGADAGYTIYSSYAKGAGLFEEWCTPLEGFGRVNAVAGTSGELDPYLSVLAIPHPLWASEDPLALTGAQSFQEPRRGGLNASEDYFLVAPDSDAAARRGTAAAAASASAMQVIKRKIYYQAVAFPPLAAPGGAVTASSLNGESTANNEETSSSRSTHSTMLGRLRRSHRKAALRPSVPVVASPRQGWIYLRYWLGMFLLRFMAFVSWLLGEKQASAVSSSSSDGSSGAVMNANNNTTNTASGGSSNGTGKAYSNVMTTAMTTIYRRLPATPSLAASTTNLPGDGDVVLQPMGYAPLVTQRYFVPLPVPILFMYGGEKRVMFHADHWCAYIRQYQRPRDGISDVVEVQGGGHWFFAEKKYQKKVADRIAEFLAAEQKTPLGI